MAATSAAAAVSGDRQPPGYRQVVSLHGCPPAPTVDVTRVPQQQKPVPPKDLPLGAAAAAAPFPASVARSLRNINPTRESLKRINSSIGQTLGEWRSMVHQQTFPAAK